MEEKVEPSQGEAGAGMRWPGEGEAAAWGRGRGACSLVLPGLDPRTVPSPHRSSGGGAESRLPASSVSVGLCLVSEPLEGAEPSRSGLRGTCHAAVRGSPQGWALFGLGFQGCRLGRLGPDLQEPEKDLPPLPLFCLQPMLSPRAGFLCLRSGSPLVFALGITILGVCHYTLTVKGSHLATHGALTESRGWSKVWTLFFVEVSLGLGGSHRGALV